MNLTRRELLRLAGVVAFADTYLDEGTQRAADFISGYSAEGFHRTATPVDRASADRLMKFARAAGGVPQLESFQLSRVDPGPAFLEIDGRRIDGLPMFDGTFTSDDGVRGAIGASGASPAAIGWTRIAPNGEAALRRIRDGSAHQAIVAVTTGGHPGLCPVNAQAFSQPFGPPVLQVSSEYLEVIDRAAKDGAMVRVVAHATRRQTTAVNVIAEVRGTRPDLPPVCVMTPRSGWHYNACERGGGLVCWLEALRAVAPAPPERTVKFVASSGHELGHLGLHEYLKRRPSLAHDAHVWLHFGANLPASTPAYSEKALEELAIRIFTSHQLSLRGSRPVAAGGEASAIDRAAGRYISFIGENEWFHNPGDRWPAAVNVGAVAIFAKATAHLAVTLATV
jgi:hypothetical protein